MTRLSGANRSTIYRWMSGGDGQPDYDLVNRLAAAIWRREPELARELVEASGYAWAEPADAPEPAIPPKALAAIREHFDPEDQPFMIEALERRLRGEPPPSGPAESASEPSSGREAS